MVAPRSEKSEFKAGPPTRYGSRQERNPRAHDRNFRKAVMRNGKSG
nr:MAG TPA: hypothetical protein [Caudoviricetes sp.]